MDTCPTAPLWIKNYQTGTTGLYIPGRYVFETLGYRYNWNATTYKSTITYVENKTGIFTADYTVAAMYNSTNPTQGSADENFYQEMELPIPDEFSPKKIEIVEKLYNNMFIIELEGDHSEFYKDAIVNTGEAVRQISVLYYPLKDITRINVCMRTDENNTIIAHNEEYMKHSIKFTFDRPQNLYDKIIILDAGHGGTDPGTKHGGYNEKDLNFNIIYKYCKELFDESDIKVFYSRSDDTLPSLYDRAGLAARVGADFFVSVHQNSNNNKAVHGTSVYYSTRNKSTFPASDPESKTEQTELLDGKIMARMFLNALLDKLGTVNRGIIDEKFVVVKEANSVPAVLIECGFMSNPDELKSLVTKKTQKLIAEAIYETVLDIYEKYRKQ
ncbi:MAG: N-acetylmuramoyl-L-alanine amidase, partial [Lachnospiraceae bacterium]|nr:N-acetylmuramoyl-L-alanine amidase [Lachnospiraceae bacterium]